MTPLKLLLWRHWSPLYTFPATFSSLETSNIGGTCSQLLWHARHLSAMGHHIQVLGVTQTDIVEEHIDFVGSIDRYDQEQLISSGRVTYPDIIFLEGGFKAASLFKSVFPKAKTVHIGQNLDTHGWRQQFAFDKYIDLFAFVSPGHFADYCVRFPRLRHKFILIRNIVPWEWIFANISPQPLQNQIAWVGAWTKRGLYQWAETMHTILAENPRYRWILYGPSHGKSHDNYVDGIPAKTLFRRLNFDDAQIVFKSLPLAALAAELSSARAVIVSLGNETACISALDAHAMGRPVISGNDMVFKYINPEGTGLRVFTAKERYKALRGLLADPGLCAAMGNAGRELVQQQYAEKHQFQDISSALTYLLIQERLGELATFRPPQLLAEAAFDLVARIQRKLGGSRMSG